MAAEEKENHVGSENDAAPTEKGNGEESQEAPLTLESILLGHGVQQAPYSLVGIAITADTILFVNIDFRVGSYMYNVNVSRIRREHFQSTSITEYLHPLINSKEII